MTTGFPDGKAGLRAGASRSEPLDVSGFTLTGNRNMHLSCGGGRHLSSFAPASWATAASVVWAAFSPRRKSLSEYEVKRSVG
jgi:hypothetical protein